MNMTKIESPGLFRANPMTPLGLWIGCFGLLMICFSVFNYLAMLFFGKLVNIPNLNQSLAV